jgi:hypothetical protein
LIGDGNASLVSRLVTAGVANISLPLLTVEQAGPSGYKIGYKTWLQPTYFRTPRL